ncbi:MAG: hypothetical protein U1E14_14625 [Geminicoccaceae bacterium]
MLGDLPKLFDRTFAVGYLLPAAFGVLGVWFVLYEYGYSDARVINSLAELDTAALAGLGIWLGAIFMLAINYHLIRLLEGYPLMSLYRLAGRVWPALGTRLQQRLINRFRRNAEQALQDQQKIEEARAEGRPDPAVPRDHPRRLWRVAETLPAYAVDMLPTRFGNRFRAFEAYPTVVYGLDAIPAWPRLVAVMPEHFRKIIADAKAMLDFCVNMVLVGVGIAAVDLGCAVYPLTQGGALLLPMPKTLLLALLTAFLAYRLALGAASQYGGVVRSAFDLYRFDLARALGLEMPATADKEREMWVTVSRQQIYRSAQRGRDLDRFRRQTY